MSRGLVTVAVATVVSVVAVWKATFIVRPDQVVVVTKFGDPVG